MAWNPLRCLRPRLCIGLDLAPQQLRLALAHRRGRQREVLRLAQAALPDGLLQDGQITDLDALAQACRALLDPACPAEAALVLGMPRTCLSVQRLILPAGSSDWERLAQVRAEMSAYGLDAADHVMDYRVATARAGQDVSLWAWAASSLAVEDRLALAAAPAASAAHDALLHLDRDDSWLLYGDTPAQGLRWRPAAAGPTALLAELAPLLRPKPQRLLLDCHPAALPAHHTLPMLRAAFARYAGLRAQPAALPADLILAPSARPPEANALDSFHLALALAWRGLA